MQEQKSAHATPSAEHRVNKKMHHEKTTDRAKKTARHSGPEMRHMVRKRMHHEKTTDRAPVRKRMHHMVLRRNSSGAIK